MDIQVQNAIEIAWNPQSDQSLKAQAFDFLNQLRENPSAWLICLSIFTKEPRNTDLVRHVALEVVNNAIQSQQLDPQNIVSAKTSLTEYITRVYGHVEDAPPADSFFLQNKLAQILTLLFTRLYESGWETFFQDLHRLVEDDLRFGQGASAGIHFYLRLLVSIHDEIADHLINATPDQQRNFTLLKDLIRERDAHHIAASWQQILSRWQTMDTQVLFTCFNSMKRWITWSDISLIANERTLDSLFQLFGLPDIEGPHGNRSYLVRDAAIEVLGETVGKKMKPFDKLEFIQTLNLEAIVTNLTTSTPLNGSIGDPDYDTEMAETVAKMVNTVIENICIVLDLVELDSSDENKVKTRETATGVLQAFVPHLLRYLSDEYDEICSTVVPGLTDLLALFRKLAKLPGGLREPFHDMVAPVLNVLITKMRYDDTSEWGEEGEESDEAEFLELRKRLKICMQSIANINQPFFLETTANHAESILSRFRSDASKLEWRDLDLALVEMTLIGELAVRNSGIAQKRLPSSVATQHLIKLMTLMLESGVASYAHASVQIQYMDICMRYHSFFEQQSQYIAKALEDFVRLTHSDELRVRLRSWHLFLRLILKLRKQLAGIAETIIQATWDLLVIRAELPKEDVAEDGMSSSQDASPGKSSTFSAQLYLFEAVGSLASIPDLAVDSQVTLVRGIIDPLVQDIQKNLQGSLNPTAELQIHHLIEAIGTLARGFSDWTPGKSPSPVLQPVSAEFGKASEAILQTLATLKRSSVIREASRFTFARLIGVMGEKILTQLPQWIESLLAESSTRDEMAVLLRLVDQIIFAFKMQIFDVLNTLLGPLLERVFSGFSQPTEGTDDSVQLTELRREYLNFLLIILNNGLDGVLVSETNQSSFETLISTLEHFAKETSDAGDARLALSVLTRMAEVWGGPTAYEIVAGVQEKREPAQNGIAHASSPALPGFHRYMHTRFSALSWAVLADSNFRPKGSFGDRLLGEVAKLQRAILAKTGEGYLSWLRDEELPRLGMQQSDSSEYMGKLTESSGAGLKEYFQKLLAQQGR